MKFFGRMKNFIEKSFEDYKTTKMFKFPGQLVPPTQVEDSGDQIPKEPAGKRRKKRWILQEYTGSHRNMEAVFRQENFRTFSGDFRPVPGGKAQESDRNAPEKIRKFSGRNTASMFQ